jgi:hypothetical protein
MGTVWEPPTGKLPLPFVSSAATPSTTIMAAVRTRIVTVTDPAVTVTVAVTPPALSPRQ